MDVADLFPLIAFLRDQPSVSEGRWAAVTTTPLATACSLLYQKASSTRHPFEVFSGFEAAADFLRLEGGTPRLQECPLD